jgi:hypothetical protein
MGYQLWILDLVAYVFGGFMASAFAGARVACDRCRRFLSTDSATVYGPVAVHAFPAVRDLVRQGQGAVALDAVRAIREPESDVRMRVAISTCGRCARQLYDVAVSRFSIGAVGYVPLGRRTPPPQRWRPVADMKVAGAVDLALHGVPVPVFTVDPAASADHHADARH